MNSFPRKALFILSLSFLLSQQTTKAVDSAWAKNLKLCAAGAFAASLVKFMCTEPNNNPVRYDMQKVKQALQELKDGINTIENLKKVRDFIWYFILDGIIGHKGKRPSLRVDPETYKVDARPGTYPKGLYGYIHGYHKGPLALMTFIIALKSLQKKSSSGWEAVKDFVFHPIDFIFDNDKNYDENGKIKALNRIAEAIENNLLYQKGLEAH